MKLIYPLLISLIPTIYSVWEDRHGDVHVKNRDWIKILIVSIVCAAFMAIFDGSHHIFIDFVRALCLILGVYILVFNWAISFFMVKVWKIVELPKGGKWYSHFSKTAIPDKWLFWNTLRWWQRLLVQILVAMWPLGIYFGWDKI